jgi:hypothetical protein
MRTKEVGPLAWAVLLAASLGTTQFSMAQMGGAGGMGGTTMGGTSQYGSLEIVGIVIGVAILILLVVLVAKKSRS